VNTEIFSQVRPLLDSWASSQPQILDWGYTPLPATQPGSAHLDTWIQAGHHANMEWMVRTAEMRKHPQAQLPEYQAAFLVLWKYPRPLPPEPEWIAAYAHGPDYHVTIGKALRDCAEHIIHHVPDLLCRPFVDSFPIAERELAAQAGLGWIGRNSMLIHPHYGSAFFISGILLSCTVPQEPHPVAFATGCTHCRKCIDACPTAAITLDKGVDARSCVSYLTIEHRGDFSETQALNAGHALFGCDICQTVCPYNKKHLSKEASVWPETSEAWLDKAPEGKGLSRMLRGTALERTGRKGLLRNLAAWMSRHEPG